MSGSPNPTPYLQNQLPPPPQTPGEKRAWLFILISMTIMMVFNLVRIQYHEYQTAKRAGKKPSWLLMWFMPVFALIMLVPLYGAAFPEVPAKIVAVLGLHVTQALAIVFAIAVGFAAFAFKLRSKLYYGTVEVFFGVISSIAVVSRVNFTSIPVSQMSLAQVTALVGSVYVVARGLTNIYEARHPKQEPKP
jgi:hypothetical protein